MTNPSDVFESMYGEVENQANFVLRNLYFTFETFTYETFTSIQNTLANYMFFVLLFLIFILIVHILNLSYRLRVIQRSNNTVVNVYIRCSSNARKNVLLS